MLLRELLVVLSTYNTIVIQEEKDCSDWELEVIKNGNKLQNQKLADRKVNSVFISPSGNVFITLGL